MRVTLTKGIHNGERTLLWGIIKGMGWQYGRKTAVVSRRTAVSSGLRIRIQLQFLVLKKLSKNCGCILEKNPVTEGFCVSNFTFTPVQQEEIMSENRGSFTLLTRSKVDGKIGLAFTV